jgi:hypothetical protein
MLLVTLVANTTNRQSFREVSSFSCLGKRHEQFVGTLSPERLAEGTPQITQIPDLEEIRHSDLTSRQDIEDCNIMDIHLFG